jgi:putative tryptophan/tyrosine transport system substrate-binding protein
MKIVYFLPVLLLGAIGCTPQSTQPTVAVSQIVEHPSLNAVRDGLKEELIANGYDPDKTLNWQWESAQGNPATAVQIAKKFAAQAPNVIVAISTPCAQAAVTSAPKTPVVFSAVTDPVNAKLVPNLKPGGGLVTGVSDLAPIGKHLDLIKKISPNTKRLGVVYNGGEANSVTLVNLLKVEAPKRGMTIVEATVTGSSGVANASKSLVGRADAVYVPTDNTVVSALESVLQVGTANKLPIFSGDNDSVERGAIASLGFNYKTLGKQTGKMVVRILKGEKPGDMPVEMPAQLDLYLNTKAAAAMGVKLPEALVKTAVKVVQ